MRSRVWRFALLIGVLLVVGILGHLRLSFDTELLSLLPPSLPEVRGLALYQKHFSGKDEALITYQPTRDAGDTDDVATASAEGARRIADALRARPDLARSVTWQPPWNEHPEDAAELLAWFWLNRPPEQFAKLAERLDPANAPARLADAVDRMTSSFSPMDLALTGFDPYGIADPELLAETGLLPGGGGSNSGGDTGFASVDGKTRILYVQLPPEVDGTGPCQKWYAGLTALIERTSGWAYVGYTGEPVFVAEISKQMEGSLKMEVVGSMSVITVLFLLMYRRIAPLLMMQLMFALTVFTTVGLGGWFIGKLNVINVGFAAMLVGLTVDYGIILYQESVSHVGLTSRKLRTILGPSIWGSCFTTAVVFGAILTSHFPAIAQLGLLVAIGMVAGALNALYIFAPAWLNWQRRHPAKAELKAMAAHSTPEGAAPRSNRWDRPALGATLAVLLCASAALWLMGQPGFDATPNALRPKKSQAYDTLDRIQAALTGQGGNGPAASRIDEQDTLLMVVEGDSTEAVLARLTKLRPLLAGLQSGGTLNSFQLPDALWPNIENQRANLATARALAANVPALAAAAGEAGFQENASFLLKGAGAFWGSVDESRLGPPPESNAVARWLMRRFASMRPGGHEYVALGLLKPSHTTTPAQVARALAGVEGVHLANWQLLGKGLLTMAQSDVVRITPVLGVLLLIMLWLVFRGLREVLLCVASLSFSMLITLVAMKLLGIQWNLLNILGLPLLMGSAADYSIHTLVALKRLRSEDLPEAEGLAHLAGIRRALIFCGLCTIAGFLSLAWSVSKGLSSLGTVCALGTLLNMLVALILLPAWWRGWDAWRSRRTG